MHLRKPGGPETAQVSVKLDVEDIAKDSLGFAAAPSAIRAIVEELRNYSQTRFELLRTDTLADGSLTPERLARARVLRSPSSPRGASEGGQV
jgi:hypothetical protein